MLEVMLQLFYGVVERNNAAVGTRLHDTAFHDGEYELSKMVEVGARREALSGVEKAPTHGGSPAVKVGGNLVVDCLACRIDFQRKPSDRAGEGEVGDQDFLPVSGEYGEDSFDGILGG